ncbi:hypothetical protein M467_05705 [Exiguobacterium chiriqhucha RW-2]|uniref:Uncharacterized protein n=1 Tax=Exiguobacterium chiriqhucha RW-2 TaxID=1345023 RepID=U1MY70_9BACL|nr:hypothetical protein M467_05705 [Exiguobacterium chiriqhucha RW-2]
MQKFKVSKKMNLTVATIGIMLLLAGFFYAIFDFLTASLSETSSMKRILQTVPSQSNFIERAEARRPTLLCSG